MSRYKKIIVLCMWILCFYASKSNAQLIQFTQNYFTPERVNPALVGLLESSSLKLLHRRQSFLSTDRLSTNYLSFNYTNGDKRSGVNFSFISDQSNTLNFFQTNEFSVSYGTAVSLTENSKLAFGVGVNYSVMSLDLSGFSTSSQFVPGRGFNELIENGEGRAINQKNSNFHTGIAYRKYNEDKIPLLEVDLSLLNLSNIFINTSFQNPTNLIGHIGGKRPIGDTYWLGGDVFFNQINTENSTIIGTSFHQIVPRASRNAYWHDAIAFHLRYNTVGYVSFATQLQKNSWLMGLSYDLYTGPTAIDNGTEFSLAYQFDPPERRKRKRRKRKKRNSNVGRRFPPKQPISPEKEEPPAKEIDIPATEDENEEVKPPVDTNQEIAEHDIQIDFDRFYLLSFKTASHQLTAYSKIYLDKVKIELDNYEGYDIVIHGHTDNVGSEEDNLKLSLKRATSIKKFLVSKGIDPSRIHTIGKGELDPLDSNDHKEGRANNRRVEIKLIKRQNNGK